MRRAVVLVVAAMLAVAPGCKRATVKDEKTFTLEPGAPHVLYIPPCKKFDVDFSAADNIPVTVSVMSKQDGDAAVNDGVVKGKKLVTKDGASTDKVSYSGGDQEMAVVFETKKKTTVTAKISGE